LIGIVHTSRKGIVGSERMNMNQLRNLGRLASLAVAILTVLVVTACGEAAPRWAAGYQGGAS
jgi:hypothetical protein